MLKGVIKFEKIGILVISLFFTILTPILNYFGSNTCIGNAMCKFSYSNFSGIIFEISFPIAIFSLIVYFLPRIYRYWSLFVLIWLPVYFLLIFTSPYNDYGHSWGIPQPSTRGLLLVVIGPIIFSLISIGIVIFGLIQKFYKK